MATTENMIITTISNTLIQDRTITAVKRVEHDDAAILVSALVGDISVVVRITPSKQKEYYQIVNLVITKAQKFGSLTQ